jgi:hypothetical protein
MDLQRSQQEQEAAASAAALVVHAREVREERLYNQNLFLANWIDGRVQGSSRACQMVIMTFSPANKDYFKEWKAKKLISEEELDKVTPPLNFFPLFSVVVGQTKNLWKGPVLGRGVGWRDSSCCFLGNTRGFAVSLNWRRPTPHPKTNFCVCCLPAFIFPLLLFCLPLSCVFVQAAEVENFTSGKKRNKGVRKHRCGSRRKKEQRITQNETMVKKAGCLCQSSQNKSRGWDFAPHPKCQCVLAKAYHAQSEYAPGEVGNLAPIVRRVMCGKKVGFQG